MSQACLLVYRKRGTKIDDFYYDALFYDDETYYLQNDVSFYLDDKFQANLRYKTLFWNTY